VLITTNFVANNFATKLNSGGRDSVASSGEMTATLLGHRGARGVGQPIWNYGWYVHIEVR
jgi:hypothetical protein